MDIVVLHIDRCPHVGLAEQRVLEALAHADAIAGVRVKVVATAEEASQRGFNGSPTILIDGRDPFPAPPGPPALACRLYPTDQGMQGAPTVAQLDAVFAE
ncbi:MAG TPA: thioredoxin family protein [Acidimicrobiales bacterium]|nr:thioredoxin family protein [Acidimicrobiales bacterium]